MSSPATNRGDHGTHGDNHVSTYHRTYDSAGVHPGSNRRSDNRKWRTRRDYKLVFVLDKEMHVQNECRTGRECDNFISMFLTSLLHTKLRSLKKKMKLSDLSF